MTGSGRRLTRLRHGLSARLLVLTIFFVLVAEVLIFVPSIARYRVTYFEEHLFNAHLVIEALRTSQAQSVAMPEEEHLLTEVGAYAVAAKRPGKGKLMLMREPPRSVDATFDMREATMVSMVKEALISLFAGGDRLFRVVGEAPNATGGYVEMVIPEAPLTFQLRAFGERILALSLVISLFTATLVYFSLLLLLVRPMRRLTESMTRFREDPENVANRIVPSNRLDEIGTAESELAAMQSELSAALHQKTRLAALGIAMTKISHDLKNMLATAQLISERLTSSDDPEVRRVAPRLEQAIDRAVNLCMQTLNFTREGPPTLDLSVTAPAELIDEVTGTLDASASAGGSPVANHVPPDLQVEADRDQLYRVFANLLWNAVEAGATSVRVEAEAQAGWLRLWVSDDGPGLPEKARQSLFQPFAGTVKRGGSGLGLAIARDLARAHGGDLVLETSSAAGTRFRLDLPRRQSAAEDRGRARRARDKAA
jgi:signal transduction histidine kinase